MAKRQQWEKNSFGLVPFLESPGSSELLSDRVALCCGWAGVGLWSPCENSPSRVLAAEDVQDGGGLRRGDHLPPRKYTRNASTCGTTPDRKSTRLNSSH